MARVLLGVTGGIAAYKALELTRLATKAGHSVRVIQTEASTRFVGQASFAAITGAPVLVTEWEPDPLRGAFPGDPQPAQAPLSHLRLAETADVFAVAPASANTLAKLAAGQADNLLCAAALAFRGPLLLAPAMNHAMYEHPATQANLATLRERGATLLEPGTGALGSPGEWGVGRLPEPPELLAAIEAALGSAPGGDLDGMGVLVTAGGTREPIDAVRFIDVETAAELAAATAAEFDRCDVLLTAAAVADYRPAAARADKIKKTEAELELRLERTEDVLSNLAERRRAGQLIVGFAAETGAGALDYGREKLARKQLDAVVVNDVAEPGIGFDSPDNEVTIVTAEAERHVPRSSKPAVAAAILDLVLSSRSSDTLRV